MKPLLKGILSVLGLALYATLSHWLFSEAERHVRLAVMWVWIPLALVGGAVFWRTRHRWLGAAVLCAATVGIWLWSEQAITSPVAILMIQYFAMQVGLAGLFGLTLLPGKVALVTRFARVIHGQLPPKIERYTRRVTWAWTLFFLILAGVATLLYVGASRERWSLFVNVLTPLVIAAMFAAEYLVRRLSFPDFPHSSIMTGVRAFQRAFDERKSG